MKISPSTFAKLSAISYELTSSIGNMGSHQLSRECVDAIHKINLTESEYFQVYSDAQFYCCYPDSKANQLGLITFYLNGDSLIICFRGTETIGDITTDIWLEDDVELTKFWLGKDFKASDCTIHSGFLYYGISGYAALAKILDISQLRNAMPVPGKIDDFISQCIFYRNFDGGTVPAKDMHIEKKDAQSIKNIYITGHSLGGAAASLLAFSWNMQKSVGWSGNIAAYTFGAPPLGNAKFIDTFNNRANFNNQRYVNHYDPVPLLLNSDMLGEYYYFSHTPFDLSLEFIRMAILSVISITPAYILVRLSFRFFSSATGLQKILGVNVLLGTLYSIGLGPVFPNSFYQPECGTCLNGNSNDWIANHGIDRYIENLSLPKNKEVRVLSSNDIVMDDRVGKWLEMDGLTNEFLKSHFSVKIRVVV